MRRIEKVTAPDRHPRWSGTLTVISLACAGLSLNACGQAPATPVPGTTSPTPDDPRLAAAEQKIDEIGKTSATFAGQVLDTPHHRIVVYRLPDHELQERIRKSVPQVTVVFRDATYSLTQMNGLVRRIMADQGYWRARGVRINGAGPEPDGSGVRVYVTDHADLARRRLTPHYPSIRLTVEEQHVIHPVYSGPPMPTITVTAIPPKRTVRP